MAHRQPPPSFKTDVNRAKTKKWTDAKSPTYDDWPDDEDEYGPDPFNDPTPPPMPKMTGLRQRGQALPQPIERGRNMTEPLPRNPPTNRERSGSFETGDDRRDFSSSSAPFSSRPAEQSSRPTKLPEAAGATTVTSTHPDASFPPRKSSLSQQQAPDMSSILSNQAGPSEAEQPVEEETSSPRTFIRPADIYKRMEAERERERQSVDSNRPSMDAIAASASTQETTPAPTYLRSPLEPVAERKSEYNMDVTPRDSVESSHSQAPVVGDPPLLPSFGRFSTFGTDLWGGSGTFTDSSMPPTTQITQGTTSESIQPNIAVQDSSGGSNYQQPGEFHSVVRDAFHNNNVENSTLSPTSAWGSQSSKDGSAVSRSNTDSTAGISPILSRDPSGATAAKRGSENISQTSPILEEPHMTSPDSRPSSSTTMRASNFQSSQSTLTHSRNISSDSASTATAIAPSNPRAEFKNESGRESPAHAPVIETSKIVPEPSSAEIAAVTPSDGSVQHTPIAEDDDQATPKSPVTRLHRYSDREADLVAKMSANPDEASVLGEAEKTAQTDFIEQRNSNPPPLMTQVGNLGGPSSGRESPSKGRVRDLATKYNEIADRSATASPVGSVASWASSNQLGDSPQRTRDVQAAVDDDDDGSDMLTAPLRPKLPGGWVSETPELREHDDPKPGIKHIPTSSSRYESNPTTPQDAYSSTADEVDLAPDPTKGANDEGEQNIKGAMAAVVAAGAAMGASITAAAGLSKNDGDEDDRNTEPEDHEPVVQRNTSHMSIEPLPGDSESDRLRKDIVRTLTPDKPEESGQPSGSSLLSPGDPRSTQARESTVSTLIPREYDSYWGMSGTQSQNQSPVIPSETFDQPKAPSPATSSRPQFLKNRFSWETAEDPEEGAEATGTEPVISPPFAVPSDPLERPSSRSSERLKGLDNLSKLETSNPVGDPYRVEEPTQPKVSAEMSRPSNDSTVDKARYSVDAKSASSALYQGSPSAGSKATPFKDIAAMQHSNQRIEAFTQSKDHFTNMDTGLSNWVAYMITTHPEHGDAAATEGLSANINTGLAGTVRQKIPPSLAKFTKTGGGTSSSPQQPYYQQYLESASQIPSSNSNPAPGDVHSSGNADKTPVSKSPNTKGKDFLHSAGVGAKGLFAKSKSKFRGSTDKVE